MAAVLVNYNAGDELRRAVQSIADEMGNEPWEGVIVDNASIDGSAASCAAFAPTVSVVLNAENVGFARGVNAGVRRTSAPIVLVMNPDCRLLSGAVAALRRALNTHPDCAIAGPRILDPDGTLQGSARGDPDIWTGLFGRRQLLGRVLPWASVSRRNVVADDAVKSGVDSVDVDWVSGACMLIRREAFEAVGGFDERYFMYWEDADLCRRLRHAGHRVRYVPPATAVHRVGHSSRTAQAASIRAFHRSALLYYTTHVAPRPMSPKRLVAGVLLAARERWQLLRSARG